MLHRKRRRGGRKPHLYGRDAIGRWKAGASSQYEYTSEPFAVAHEDNGIVVTSRVTGNFPGSPVDLRYAFVLDGAAIARPEITR